MKFSDDESREVACGMMNRKYWVGTKAGLNLNYMSDFYRLSHSLNAFIYKMGLLIPTSVRQQNSLWTTLGKRELLEKYEHRLAQNWKAVQNQPHISLHSSMWPE